MRLPSANKEEEVNLYRFLYKRGKRFEENRLNAKEEAMYIEVARILQNKR